MIAAQILAQRGTKRTCQNAECESRFYDLNRDPIACPICEAAYTPAPTAPARAAGAERSAWKTAAKTLPDEVKAEPVADADDLPGIEGEEAPAVEVEEDTLLQEVEEDSANVADIIDAPTDPGRER